MKTAPIDSSGVKEEISQEQYEKKLHNYKKNKANLSAQKGWHRGKASQKTKN